MVIYALMVNKFGDRKYWEQWAGDVAKIAESLQKRIDALVKNPAIQQSFQEFVASLQVNINPSVTAEAAIKMLAQHMVTRPVFEALFENYSFAQQNPVSIAMQHDHAFEKDTQDLAEFYTSVVKRVANIDKNQAISM